MGPPLEERALPRSPRRVGLKVGDGKEEESLKKGEKYRCQKCGLIVTIESPCTCTACDLICCGLPLKPVKK